MAQSDLILLFLTGLSVLIGLSRGFTLEVLRLVVWVFSGVLGYMLIPVVKPVVEFIPNEPVQKMAAVLLGTFVAWIILKMIMHSIVGTVKKSSLKKLDRSLGGIFGAVRAGFFCMLVAVFFGIVSPATVQASKVMMLSYAGAGKMIDALPKLEAGKQENQDGEENKEQAPEGESNPAEKTEGSTVFVQRWKKSLADYLENTIIHTKSGDKKLIEAVASILVKSFSKEMTEKGGLDVHKNGEQIQIFSDEEKTQIMEKTFERQLVYWLNGKNPSGKEMQDFAEELTMKKLAGQ